MLPTTESQHSQLGESQPIATQNSSIAYGVGSFGLESLHTVFAFVSTFIAWLIASRLLFENKQAKINLG